MERANKNRGDVWFWTFLLTLMVVWTVWLFLGKVWWFPELASVHGADIDFMFTVTFIGVGILFVLFHLILGFLSVRYSKNTEEVKHRVDRKLEYRVAGAVAVVIFLFDVTLAIMGETAWMKVYAESPADAITVEVTGGQFAWYIRYPGDDGVFGRTDVHLMDSATNPLGIDPDDSYGNDDIFTVGDIHLPVDRPVNVFLRSKDVLHSFFLPNQRIKQDAVPGMTMKVSFTPNLAGSFELACAQLCGLGHYRMAGNVTIESQDEFATWLTEQSID